MQQRHFKQICTSACVATLLAFTTQLAILALAVKECSAARDLIILTWPDYVDPQITKDFERAAGVKVKYILFNSDDVRNIMLLKADTKGFDIVAVNEVMADRYAKQGWLAPLSKKAMPNLRHIDAKWNARLRTAAGYAVPYFWGTLGIAYRSDLVSTKMTSWNDLLKPSKALKGKIAMVRNSVEVLGVALKALGYSSNSTEPDQLQRAQDLLLGQKPFVAQYDYVGLTEKSSLVTGEIIAALAYNGDAIALNKYHPKISYVVPVEGTIIWADYLAVLAASQNKDLAMKYIDFINRPQVAARNAEFLNFATPNKGAEKLLPATFLKDENIYPKPEVLARCEIPSDLPPRSIKQRNSIFSGITNY